MKIRIPEPQTVSFCSLAPADPTMKKQANRGLVGVWISCDPWGSRVEHHISISKGIYNVKVIDSEDKEKGDVYDIKWDGNRLHYSCHWKSTGRFLMNSLLQVEKEKVSLTYSYTDSEILHKKNKNKKNA